MRDGLLEPPQHRPYAESLTIIGGGVIAYGVRQHLRVVRLKGYRNRVHEQILPPFDSDIAKRLKQTLTKKGIKIITSAAAKKSNRTPIMK